MLLGWRKKKRNNLSLVATAAGICFLAMRCDAEEWESGSSGRETGVTSGNSRELRTDWLAREFEKQRNLPV